MADGSVKPVSAVRLGDWVRSTDTATGRDAVEPVVVLHHNHDTDLAEVTVATSDGKTSVLHTTAHHPFWSQTEHGWVNAGELKPGTALHVWHGTSYSATVVSVKTWTGLADRHDLTVATLHTYYVIAGDTPVLVHNCNDEAIVHLDRQNGHASITVRNGNDVLHTEQVGRPGTRAIAQEFDGQLGNPRLDVPIPLPNASLARSFQDVTLGQDLGAYDEMTRSCITYCAEVLRQGGVAGIPLEDGSIAITKWLIRQLG